MMTVDDGFQTLRITCEASAPMPAIVLVGSVADEDGALRVARGLVDAFAEHGARTLLVTDARSDRRDGADVMTFAELGVAERNLPDLRGRYDATVIVPPPLGSSSRGLELARHADGIVLTVRLGRAVTAVDERIASDLRRVGAAIIGVVTTRAGAERPRKERAANAEPRRTAAGASTPLSKGTNAWRSS